MPSSVNFCHLNFTLSFIFKENVSLQKQTHFYLEHKTLATVVILNLRISVFRVVVLAFIEGAATTMYSDCP